MKSTENEEDIQASQPHSEKSSHVKTSKRFNNKEQQSKNLDSLDSSPSQAHGETLRNNFVTGVTANQKILDEYEEIIQKLEGDIRNHIRIEQ